MSGKLTCMGEEVERITWKGILLQKTIRMLDAYKEKFFHLQSSEIKLLEIGVDWGGSLCFFADYFQNGKIVGVDLPIGHQFMGKEKKPGYDKIVQMYKGRISIEFGSQIDSNFLKLLDKKHGPFDIIIDDASHASDKTKKTFRGLFPVLKMGGYYVIEDWNTGSDSQGMIQAILNLVSIVAGNGVVTDERIKIEHMDIRYKHVFIKKGFPQKSYE